VRPQGEVQKGWSQDREFGGCSWWTSRAEKLRGSGEQSSSGSDPVEHIPVFYTVGGTLDFSGRGWTEQDWSCAKPECARIDLSFNSTHFCHAVFLPSSLRDQFACLAQAHEFLLSWISARS